MHSYVSTKQGGLTSEIAINVKLWICFQLPLSDHPIASEFLQIYEERKSIKRKTKTEKRTLEKERDKLYTKIKLFWYDNCRLCCILIVIIVLRCCNATHKEKMVLEGTKL